MPSIKSEWDAVVVGAGPAGLAAATLLANRGVDVLLLDEQPEPGGQIYRGVERNASAGSAVRAVFGDDYFHGAELVRAFRASSAVYVPGANVWRVTQDRKIYASDGAASMAFQARCIILATGAIERPVAIPGWTLPGVMTAGALQILLKTSGLVPTAPTVIAGTGPLFYLLAQQSLAAGANIVALLDTQPRGTIFSASRYLPAALMGKGPSYLLKGLRLKARIKASNCVVYRDVSDVVVEGNG